MQHPTVIDAPADTRHRFPYFAAAGIAAFTLVLGALAARAGVPLMAVVLAGLAAGSVTTAALAP